MINLIKKLLKCLGIDKFMSRSNRKPSFLQNKTRVLFIIKERSVYNTKTKAYGLFNSCKFVANKLRENGIYAQVEQVVDNNEIDKVVAKHKPTHCFIEAIWVVPSKFEILSKLHPSVKWYIRLHSMIPFLSSEGMAFEWINEYLGLRNKRIDISISCNNKVLYQNLKNIYGNYISYTPNIYCPEDIIQKEICLHNYSREIDIGCFGALRVLKNHTQQAIWAIDFANDINKKLNFHVNLSEHEQREAGPVLRNLRAIFKNTRHELVEHQWYEHKDFIEVVKTMDLGMQISFSETFNITAADFVYAEVPIVVSNEIKFVDERCRVDTSSHKKVQEALHNAYCHKNIVKSNKKLLIEHNKDASAQWLEFLKEHS